MLNSAIALSAPAAAASWLVLLFVASRVLAIVRRAHTVLAELGAIPAGWQLVPIGRYYLLQTRPAGR